MKPRTIIVMEHEWQVCYCLYHDSNIEVLLNLFYSNCHVTVTLVETLDKMTLESPRIISALDVNSINNHHEFY